MDHSGPCPWACSTQSCSGAATELRWSQEFTHLSSITQLVSYLYYFCLSSIYALRWWPSHIIREKKNMESTNCFQGLYWCSTSLYFRMNIQSVCPFSTTGNLFLSSTLSSLLLLFFVQLQTLLIKPQPICCTSLIGSFVSVFLIKSFTSTSLIIFRSG